MVEDGLVLRSLVPQHTPSSAKLTFVPPEHLEKIAGRMRSDWNARALEDAQHYVYTRDPDSDELAFDESGRANYAQLVQPYLPVLLRGAAAHTVRALEIGCGVGRMTRCFAEHFAEVHAIDIAPEMIAQARTRLAAHSNVTLHIGSGFDLQPLPGAHFDLVFSYIVFQHIPSADVIRNYVREAARVLKPLGAFKFQINGDQSSAYREHERDTWLGETFSREEVEEMLREAGLTLAHVEDPGSQYFVVTAFKGPAPDRQTYFLPGEPEDGGWRPAEPRTSIRLRAAENGTRIYAGIYFWPADPHQEHQLTMSLNGKSLGIQSAQGPGDHHIEWTLPPRTSGDVEITLDIAPACDRDYRPALRIVGITP